MAVNVRVRDITIPRPDTRTLVGIGLAAAAALLVLWLTRPAPTIPILVAGSDLPAATPISELDLSVRHTTDATGMVIGDSPGDLSDWVLVAPLAAGEPLLPSLLRPPEVQTAPNLLALEIDEAHAVLGRLDPGDRRRYLRINLTTGCTDRDPADRVLGLRRRRHRLRLVGRRQPGPTPPCRRRRTRRNADGSHERRRPRPRQSRRMSVRVATVLSARDWEPGLVAYARETAEVLIVLRAFQPHEIEEHAADIDVVVAGGEVSWVTPVQIALWQRAGLGVLGIHPQEDGPAASMLRGAGVDEILPDTADVRTIVTAIRFISPLSGSVDREGTGSVTAVVGPRGAPGTTEVALGLAWESSRSGSTLLVDLDIDAPSIAIRLGLPPRPDITDAADEVRASGVIAPDAVQQIGPVSVITGSHRIGEAPLRTAMVEDLIDAATVTFERVIVDLGTCRTRPPDPQAVRHRSARGRRQRRRRCPCGASCRHLVGTAADPRPEPSGTAKQRRRDRGSKGVDRDRAVGRDPRSPVNQSRITGRQATRRPHPQAARTYRGEPMTITGSPQRLGFLGELLE